ncbi:MAG: toast rack family protein [Acidobacteriota bacterium]
MRTARIVCLAAAALAASGCVRYERRETSETRAVELGAAQKVRIQVEMGAGDLRIEGHGGNLLDGEFHYSVAEWRPEVKYDVSGGRGYLTVRQPPIRGFATGEQDNRWDLRLNDRVPLDLRVNLGAGQGDLKLSGMNVRRLEVAIGAGELKLDLRGPWDSDFEGSIHGGVGQATVRLPREVGVRVHATGGIGGIDAQGLRKEGDYFFNDAYDAAKSQVRLRLDITGGIGQINLIG